jgi:hypothetical protein
MVVNGFTKIGFIPIPCKVIRFQKRAIELVELSTGRFLKIGSFSRQVSRHFFGNLRTEEEKREIELVELSTGQHIVKIGKRFSPLFWFSTNRDRASRVKYRSKIGSFSRQSPLFWFSETPGRETPFIFTMN